MAIFVNHASNIFQESAEHVQKLLQKNEVGWRKIKLLVEFVLLHILTKSPPSMQQNVEVSKKHVDSFC